MKGEWFSVLEIEFLLTFLKHVKHKLLTNISNKNSNKSKLRNLHSKHNKISECQINLCTNLCKNDELDRKSVV